MIPVFIVAAPRSGTTFLAELFNKHPQVASWHEPYFIWQYHLGKRDDDLLTANDVTPKVEKFVRKEFKKFSHLSNKPVLLEKTPVNAFKIDFINAIFPDAKWIHLYRNGHGVINSLKQRYQRRYEIVNNKSIKKFIEDVKYTLVSQPFWRHRFLAMLYELKTLDHLSPYCPTARREDVIFGPRYPGWKQDRENLSDIEFMAKQWVESELTIEKAVQQIPVSSRIEVRYEDLVTQPKQQLEIICKHLELECTPLYPACSKIRTSSIEKWRSGLDDNEVELIKPIITDALTKLGYIT